MLINGNKVKKEDFAIGYRVMAVLDIYKYTKEFIESKDTDLRKAEQVLTNVRDIMACVKTVEETMEET